MRNALGPRTGNEIRAQRLRKTSYAALSSGLATPMLLSGAVFTFFSFMGFEDMLNVAEEVKRPQLTMPWGIVLALLIVTVLYLGVAATAVSVVHYRDLAAAPAPLRLIANRAAPWLPASTFSIITLFAVANTMLINYIMGSRLLYGMSRQGLLPAFLGHVHARWHTPHLPVVALLVVLILALSGGGEAVKTLASAKALLLILAFVVVNLALVVLKLRPDEPVGAFEVPLWVPILGIVINATLIVARVTSDNGGYRAPGIAGIIVLVVMALYFVTRPATIAEQMLAAAEHEM